MANAPRVHIPAVAQTIKSIPTNAAPKPVSAPQVGAPAPAPTTSYCAPGDPTKFDYVRRVNVGGKWTCPAGTIDTGCSWSDGVNGERQCRKPKAAPAPAPAPAKSQCAPGDPAKFDYVRRADVGGKWTCPAGTIYTGCTWADGAVNGERQCRKPKGPSLVPLPGGKDNKFVMTMYSFQDNTPSNSVNSSSGQTLVPFVSVAVVRRMIKKYGGTLNYGDYLHVKFLQGRKMPNGTLHTGWVRVDDYCGDNGDDDYCYQKIQGSKYPIIDLWIGDITVSGQDTRGKCDGPAGNGQELTDVYQGNPGAAFIQSYGGRSAGTGKCGDSAAGRRDHGNCYYYAASASSSKECK